MIKLIDINEQNWMDVARLSVKDAQKGFLDSPIGILARGYAYRAHRAQVIGIVNDNTVVGVALVKDLDEEPACYDLQQYMIDWRFQGCGYGTEALRLILARLKKEHKYDRVEICVNKADTAALYIYKKVGFVDTGYVDESMPDNLNLAYQF